MPYGIAKKLGGDTAKNVAKAEGHIKGIMKSGHSKVSAIKIEKAAEKKRGHV